MSDVLNHDPNANFTETFDEGTKPEAKTGVMDKTPEAIAEAGWSHVAEIRGMGRTPVEEMGQGLQQQLDPVLNPDDPIEAKTDVKVDPKEVSIKADGTHENLTNNDTHGVKVSPDAVPNAHDSLGLSAFTSVVAEVETEFKPTPAPTMTTPGMSL